MEIWRARPLLRCIVHSSFALFKKTPQRSFQTLVRWPPVASASSALFKNTPRRSFQTLVRWPPVASDSSALFKNTPRRSFQTLVRWPPVAPSSSCYLRRCLFVSQPQRRQLFHFSPQAPAVVRTLSSLSLEQQSACSENARYQHNLVEVEQEKQSRVIPVKAYFLCTDIDLKTLQAQNFAFNVTTPNSKSTNFAIYAKYLPHGDCQYMVVFQYGSIVLFNVPDHEVGVYLKTVKKHASGLLPKIKKDDYVVVEKPTLETWVQGGLDSVMLKNLSIDGIGTIGSVLGQNMALDYHIRQFNQMVTKLEDINCQIVNSGTYCWQTISQNLSQLVSDVNSKLDFISHKLEILKRSNIRNDAQIWECLSTEFGLTEVISTLNSDLLQAMNRTLELKLILKERYYGLETVILQSTIILMWCTRMLMSFTPHHA